MRLKVKNKLTDSRGFSLLEMVVYIAIMTLIMIVVINTLVVIIFTQRDVKSLKAIEHSAIAGFDRIVREIRDADSLVSAGNSLVLNTLDELNNLKTVEFFVDGNDVLQFRDGTASSSPLTSSAVKVTGLTFYNISSGEAQTIKVEMSLEAGQGQFLRSENFYTSATFR